MKHKDVCAANYEGCAPMMQVEGIKRIFERSIESRNVRYLKLFGDGDSNAYLTVKNTYCPDMVETFECGTVSKAFRMSSPQVEKEQGLNSLTEPVIDKLQNYFGIALRSNTGDTVEQMTNATRASFF